MTADPLTTHRKCDSASSALDDDGPVEILSGLFDAHPVLRGVPRAIAYMIGLPHRALRAGDVWIKDFGEFAIVIQPGRLFMHGDRVGEAFGVPFGPRARMLFAYLVTQCWGEDRFEVERGGLSLNRWAERFGLSIGGKTYTAFRDQELRVAVSSFMTTFRSNGYEGAVWDRLYVKGMRPDSTLCRPRSTNGKRNMVRLSAELFDEVSAHPTRIPMDALARLSNQSLGLDIYFWLAYRLPLLREAEPVTWSDLARCFGTSYRQTYHFEPRFREKLKLVLGIYPGAAVDICAEGLILHPSPRPTT